MPIGLRITLLFLACLLAPIAAAQGNVRRAPDFVEATRLVVGLTNDFRRAEGAGMTAVETKLSAAARYFANYMASTDRYGHDADGKPPAQRAREHGYDYCLVAENIASLYSSAGFTASELAEHAVRGWKQSPGHRKNMLDVDATEIGVAFARSDKSATFYAVQMFGRPKAKQIEFRIANVSPAAVDYELDGKSYGLPSRATRVHQQCRAPRLVVRLPGQPQSTTVQPQNGERLAVERAASGEYRLKKS